MSEVPLYASLDALRWLLLSHRVMPEVDSPSVRYKFVNFWSNKK